MKPTLIVLAGLIGLTILIILSGYLLPKNHVATSERDFEVSPEELFRVVRDFREYSTWRTGLKNLEPESENIWTEFDAHGNKIRYGIQEEKPGRYIRTKILNEDLPFGGEWEFEFLPIPVGTKLRIVETGFVTNPLFRLLSKFVFGYNATMDIYLEDLSRKFRR